MGSGLFPAFGIFHRNRYNAFPLADDVMEPYRPFVDELVYGLRMQGESQLTQEVKGTLLRILFADTRFEKVDASAGCRPDVYGGIAGEMFRWNAKEDCLPFVGVTGCRKSV